MDSPVSSAGLSSGGLVSPGFLQSLTTLVVEVAYNQTGPTHRANALERESPKG